MGLFFFIYTGNEGHGYESQLHHYFILSKVVCLKKFCCVNIICIIISSLIYNENESTKAIYNFKCKTME